MDRTTLPYPARAFADAAAAYQHGVTVEVPRPWRNETYGDTARVRPTHEVTDLGCIRPTSFTKLDRWMEDIASVDNLPTRAQAAPGRTLLTLDLPLLPLWVLASRSRDTHLGMVLYADDPWDELASCLFAPSEYNARKADLRSIAKAAVFSWTSGKAVRPSEPSLDGESASAAQQLKRVFPRAERWLGNGDNRWDRWKSAEATAFAVQAEILDATLVALTGRPGNPTPALIVNSLPVVEADVDSADQVGAAMVTAAEEVLAAAVHIAGRRSYRPTVHATAGPTLAEQGPLPARAE